MSLKRYNFFEILIKRNNYKIQIQIMKLTFIQNR